MVIFLLFVIFYSIILGFFLVYNVSCIEGWIFFVFGDFFVDSGNNNYLVIFVCVDFLFYGIDYFMWSFIGCFFNGFNIFDIISWVFMKIFNIFNVYMKFVCMFLYMNFVFVVF